MAKPQRSERTVAATTPGLARVSPESETVV